MTLKTIGTATLLACTSSLAALADSHSSASYCENGFIEGDQNADGTYSDAELERMRDAVFQSLDANDDGAITREEAAACTGRADKPESTSGEAQQDDEEMDAAFDNTDMNRDGFVDRAEFTERATAAYEDNAENDDSSWQAPFMPATTEVRDKAFSQEAFASAAREGFDARDADLDGRLSREEWIAVEDLESAEFDDMRFDFEATDSDTSGDVTREEFDARADRVEEDARNAAEAAGREGDGVPVIYYVFYNIG